MSPGDRTPTDSADECSASAHIAREPTHDAEAQEPNRLPSTTTATAHSLCVDHGFEPATGGHPHVSEDEAKKPGEARPRGSEDTSKMSHEPFKPEEPTFQPTHRLQNIRADPNSVQFLVSTKNQTCSAKDVEVGDGSLQIVASGEEALARIAEALGSPQSISAARQSSQVSRFDSYGRGQVLGTAQMQREQDRNRK